ncbi:MAG: FliO/MopB family protein [Planctomycetota bacterium]
MRLGWLDCGRIGLLLLLQALLWSADDAILQRPLNLEGEQEASTPASPPEVGGALTTAIGLAIAMGGIGLGLLWWARQKGWVAAPGHRTRPGALQLRDSLPLGMKRSIALVQYGEHAVLVAVSEQGLSHLATLPVLDAQPSEPSQDLPDSEALEPPPPPQPGTATFRAKLRALTEGPH